MPDFADSDAKSLHCVRNTVVDKKNFMFFIMLLQSHGVSTTVQVAYCTVPFYTTKILLTLYVSTKSMLHHRAVELNYCNVLVHYVST